LLEISDHNVGRCCPDGNRTQKRGDEAKFHARSESKATARLKRQIAPSKIEKLPDANLSRKCKEIRRKNIRIRLSRFQFD
jgi:hypothetical protein